MTRSEIRRHYAIGQQKVRMELPAGTEISRVELLRAEEDIRFDQSGRIVEFEIPSVEAKQALIPDSRSRRDRAEIAFADLRLPDRLFPWAVVRR